MNEHFRWYFCTSSIVGRLFLEDTLETTMVMEIKYVDKPNGRYDLFISCNNIIEPEFIQHLSYCLCHSRTKLS